MAVVPGCLYRIPADTHGWKRLDFVPNAPSWVVSARIPARSTAFIVSLDGRDARCIVAGVMGVHWIGVSQLGKLLAEGEKS